MAEITQVPAVQLASIDETNEEVIVPVAPYVPQKPLPYLINGNREEYIKVGIPLYEASIKGDWKAAKAIIDKKPELEVESMIPPSYRERKNKDGLTPYELFTKEHKDLVAQGEKWMKETASQCMVVAALIATIVFAAAFTVPGGYNQSSGIPIFHSEATFMVFVVADAISLFASVTSILMFLAILTSRYAERDFLRSLPQKLMLGLAALFLSITTMTIAFSVSFYVLYKKGLIWMPIVISLFAGMPVVLFALLQYPLLGDVFRSTYGSRYLFRPKKRVLYYEDSKPVIMGFFSRWS